MCVTLRRYFILFAICINVLLLKISTLNAVFHLGAKLIKFYSIIYYFKCEKYSFQVKQLYY